MAAAQAAAYVRVQAAVAGLVNAVVNPAIDWVSGNGDKPIWAKDGLVINFVVTSVVLSVLVAVFTAFGLHHALRAGHIYADGTVTVSWLSWLPRRGWLLGLVVGAIAALVTVAVLALLHAIGVETLSLAGLLLVKAVYCGMLGFLVARWAILRALLAAGE